MPPLQRNQEAVRRWIAMAGAVSNKTKELICILNKTNVKFTASKSPEIMVHEKLAVWAQSADVNSLTDQQAVENSIQGFWADTQVPTTSNLVLVTNPPVEDQIDALAHTLSTHSEEV